MHTDDILNGRLLSRREVLSLLGAAGATFLVGCSDDDESSALEGGGDTSTLAPAGESPAAATATTAVPSCVVVPELTEGPYFVDEQLNRSDIRSDPSTGTVKEGALFTISLNVSRVSAGACAPLSGAMFDIWHCDALGVYSDVSEMGFNTIGQQFLRGYQLTDANGASAVHDRLPRLVPGTGDTYSLQDQDWQPGIHVAVLLRRQPIGPNQRPGSVCPEGGGRPAQELGR
jgi:hypothetical protein